MLLRNMHVFFLNNVSFISFNVSKCKSRLFLITTRYSNMWMFTNDLTNLLLIWMK